MTASYARDDFSPHVDKVFRVRGGHHALTLTHIDGLSGENHKLPPGFREPFNLIFRGPPGDLLKEGMYTMEVEGGVAFDLYMIPIYTPFPGRQDYQAAFN